MTLLPVLRFRPAFAIFAALVLVASSLAQTSTGSGTGSGTSTGSGTPTGTGSGTTSSTTIGYYQMTNTASPSVYTFASGMTSSTDYALPFQVNSLGTNFSADIVSLLVQGNANLSDLALSVTDTLPTSTSLPTALVTYSFVGSGTIASTPTAYTFNATSTVTLSANTTYYLIFGYNGTGSLDWVRENSLDNGAASASLTPLTTPVGDGAYITYRVLGSSSFSDHSDQTGGFSITANAISAVPEPAAYAAIVGAITIALGLGVRWQRHRRRLVVPSPEPPTAA